MEDYNEWCPSYLCRFPNLIPSSQRSIAISLTIQVFILSKLCLSPISTDIQRAPADARTSVITPMCHRFFLTSVAPKVIGRYPSDGRPATGRYLSDCYKKYGNLSSDDPPIIGRESADYLPIPLRAPADIRPISGDVRPISDDVRPISDHIR